MSANRCDISFLSDIEEINQYDTIFDSNDIVYLSKEEIQHLPGDIFCKLWSKISGKELEGSIEEDQVEYCVYAYHRNVWVKSR